MHRIDHATRKINLHGAGKDGFTEGSPGVEAATVMTADIANALQEEIANAVEERGLTLAKADNTQLAQALATPLGVLEARFVTPDGWVRLPSPVGVTKYLGPERGCPNSTAGVAAWDKNGGYDPDFLMAVIEPSWTTLTDRARLSWSLDGLFGLGVSVGTQVTGVRALVQPGVARPTANNRMRLNLFSSEFVGGAWTSSLHGQETDDGSTDQQEIVLTLGTPALLTQGKVFTLEVQSGTGLDPEVDSAFRIGVTYTTDTHLR